MPKNVVSSTMKISKKLGRNERLAIAEEILDYIKERTNRGHGKNDRPWRGSKANEYSKSYKNSLDFKQKSSKGRVNLELSGDMLTAIEAKQKSGEIKIHIPFSEDEWGRAKGNILGSYGKKAGNKSKARNFLELGRKDHSEIMKRFKNSPIGKAFYFKNEEKKEILSKVSSDVLKGLITGKGEKKKGEKIVEEIKINVRQS